MVRQPRLADGGDAETTRFGKRKVSVLHREYEVNVIEAAIGSALRMRSG